MNITLTFHWYWIGVAAAALGMLLIIVGPSERGSFGGWGYTTPGIAQLVGLVLVALGLAFLSLGWLARMLP